MILSLALAVLIVLLFEGGVFAPMQVLAGGQSLFISTIIMQLLTIGGIPFALYLFRIPRIHSQLTASDDSRWGALLRWGSLRMMLLCLPMVVNVLFYYLSSLTVAFAYMAIILAICLVFVYPSAARCAYDTTKREE